MSALLYLFLCFRAYSVMLEVYIRWVSVVEFHDPTLGIGKVFGQESTVVKWNYQILGLHQVTVHQKLGVILVIKWFKNWSHQKMLFTKKVRLNSYSSMNFFLERFGWLLTYKIHFESPKLALFDKLSPDGDSKSGNFIWLQLILGQKPCLCRVPHHEIPLPKLIYWRSSCIRNRVL